MSNEFWVIREYDAIVKASGADGLTFEESKKLIAEAYARGVESGVMIPETTDPFTVGYNMAHRYLTRLRTSRRMSMRNVLYSLIMRRGLDVNTIAVLLDNSYPLGTQDGQDKTLWYWGRQDFQKASKIRHDKADQLKEAALDFDSRVTAVVAMIREKRVRFFGDCFDLPPETSS